MAQERIVSAATKALTGEVFTGRNHGEIGFATANLFKYKGSPKNANWNGDQGFWTSHQRFVNRTEAALIALLAKQIDSLHFSSNELDSSDINDYSIDGSKLA